MALDRSVQKKAQDPSEKKAQLLKFPLKEGLFDSLSPYISVVDHSNFSQNGDNE